MAVGFLAASLSTARLLRRFGRRIMTVGALAQALGLAGTFLSLWGSWPHPNPWTLCPPVLLAGIGQGLIMSPLIGVVLSDVPPRRAGVGSGVFTTTQQTALALGVATIGTLYLTFAPANRWGSLNAILVVLGALVVVALAVAAMSLRLPNPVPTGTQPVPMEL
jgi:MFS family permease